MSSNALMRLSHNQPGWAWAAARSRGLLHAREKTTVQDAFACFAAHRSRRVLVALLSDGAGTALHARQGAALVCRTLGVLARQHFATRSSLPDEGTVRAWLRAVRERIAIAAIRRGLTPRDFSATLVMALSTGLETLTVHVGDGCVVARPTGQENWTALSWPEHGDYAAETYFVTDDSLAHTRIVRHATGVSALALFSDGLERLVLDLRTRQAHSPFFTSVISHVEQGQATGRQRELSLRLKRFLDGQQVNSRTDDDKTLILAVRR